MILKTNSEDVNNEEKLMVCPVCKNKINNNSIACPICCFKDFQTEFINKDEANNWIQNVVKPYRKKWEYKIDVSYLVTNNRYPDYIKLKNNIENTPDDFATATELVGLLYGIIFNPTHKSGKIKLRETGIQELIKLNKHYINQIDFSESTPEKQIVKMRMIYLRALISLIDGDIKSAYDLFISVAEQTEQYCQKTDKYIGSILSLFVYSEINMHQILTMFGISDESFFDIEHEELVFFKNKNMPLEFTSTQGYIISTFTPLYHKYTNPFADMHPDAVAHNMRTLHMYVRHNELNITIRCVGNKEFVVNGNECEWCFNRNIVAEDIRNYLENNKYKKINGKIHNIIGFASISN